MYYDRHIDPELANVLMPGGPLTWLMEHVRSSEGRARHAHLEFRRNRDDRPRGSIQLYWGRTSPLEFWLQRGGKIRLEADEAYHQGSKELFSKPIPISQLHGLEVQLRDHLRRAAERLAEPQRRRQAFISGEAIFHAGLLRRYGHGWQSGDPILLLDSEAQIGFSNACERAVSKAELQEQLGLSRSASLPTKLDAIGVVPGGDLALIEVKDEGGNIKHAVGQIVVHMARFSRLLAEGSLEEALRAMLEQKRATDVLPKGSATIRQGPRLIPWIAAPDQASDWPSAWERAVSSHGANFKPYLPELTLVRLDHRGHILKMKTP